MTGLLGSDILEVAIGLFFIYFLLSVICSHINEILSSLLKLRARNLEVGIYNLLCGSDLFGKVMNHQLVKAMGTSKDEPLLVQFFTKRPSRRDLRGKPDYIPSRTFALALFDSLVNGTDLNQPASAQADVASVTNSGAMPPSVDIPSSLPANPPDNSVIAARKPLTLANVRTSVAAYGTSSGSAPAAPLSVSAVQRSAKTEQELGAADGRQEVSNAISSLIEVGGAGGGLRSLDDLQRSLNELLSSQTDDIRDRILKATSLPALRDEVASLRIGPETGLPAQVKVGILHIIDGVEGDINAALTSVEQWYDNAMERVTDVYKRQIQLWLLGIALILSLVLGADTFAIAGSLANNPSQRTAIVGAAQQTIGAIEASSTPTSVLQPATTVMTTTVSTGGGTTPPETTITTTTTIMTPTIGIALAKLQDLGVPLGYGDLLKPENNKDPVWSILRKIVGILVTTIALSLGAPFWFDVLKKVSNIRATGTPPDEQKKT